jgi:hypothetical protein
MTQPERLPAIEAKIKDIVDEDHCSIPDAYSKLAKMWPVSMTRYMQNVAAGIRK